jgi:2-dehydro-3-deoxy-D-gluconate 5-dehydrogenase
MNVLNLFDLKGKTALVTGCNRGIGMSMALALAEAGADIIGVSHSIALNGSEIENGIKALGRSFKAYQCDLGDRGSIKNFIAKVTTENERIDILINNAGMILRDPVAE